MDPSTPGPRPTPIPGAAERFARLLDEPAREWLRAAAYSGCAHGADLRIPGGFDAESDALRAWWAAGWIAPLAFQPTFTQRAFGCLEATGAAAERSIRAHFGVTPKAWTWGPGPSASEALAAVPYPKPEPELPVGKRDADGFRLVLCFAGGPHGRRLPRAHVAADGTGYCDVCSQDGLPVRPDNRLERHVCPDLQDQRDAGERAFDALEERS